MNLEALTPITEDTDIDEEQSPATYAPYRVSDDVWMVPCKLNPGTHDFAPLCRLGVQDSYLDNLTARHIWMAQEDKVITELVALYGKKAWSLIASELNKAIHAGKPVRLSKQCRERWLNHLDPYLKKGNWTADEDLFILERRQQLGNRWSEISRYLMGRNENAVKNRWNSLVKRAEKERPHEIDAITYLIGQKQNQRQMVSQVTQATESSQGSQSGSVQDNSPYQMQIDSPAYTMSQALESQKYNPRNLPEGPSCEEGYQGHNYMMFPSPNVIFKPHQLAPPQSMPMPQAIRSLRNHLFDMAKDGCSYDNTMSFSLPKSFF